MDNLRNMHSKTNSLEGIREKFKSAIINNYRERLTTLTNKEHVRQEDIDQARRYFMYYLSERASDNSLDSNARWGIVGRKNFFGLSAELFPRDEVVKKDSRLFLKLGSGRFQMEKFNRDFFPNMINISDILRRSEDEQFAELEEFYNMNNRTIFEKFGVNARCGDAANLIANCVILDSLLQDKYSEMEDVYCYTPRGYVIEIKLEDGTEIIANTADLSTISKKGITIKKDGKEANVDFDAISKEKSLDILTSINDLEVENVVYTGEPELIEKLQQAMQEQFQSQKIDKEEIQSNELGLTHTDLVRAAIAFGIGETDVRKVKQMLIDKDTTKGDPNQDEI